MSDSTPQPRWRRVSGWVYRQAKHLLALFGLGVLVWYGWFDLSQLTTRGMKPLLHTPREGSGDHVLSEGYFVLGDDGMDIFDSRFEMPVTRHALIGRPWLIVAPGSRIGLISHKRRPPPQKDGGRLTLCQR